MKMDEQKFYETLVKHDIDDAVTGIYDDYDGRYEDSRVIVVEGYGLRRNEKAVLRWLEMICYENDEYEWTFADQVTIDFEDGCAYADSYGEADVILGDCEILGRRQFENGDLSFDDVVDIFVNNSERALPSWLDPTDGWEQQSCDFESGWYGREDDPQTILEKLGDDLDVLFQIDFVQPFATGFCVWTKERL